VASSGEMLRGSTGIVGGGIYLAASPQQTDRKSHQRGCMVDARVYRGKVLPLTPGQHHLHADAVQAGGLRLGAAGHGARDPEEAQTVGRPQEAHQTGPIYKWLR